MHELALLIDPGLDPKLSRSSGDSKFEFEHIGKLIRLMNNAAQDCRYALAGLRSQLYDPIHPLPVGTAFGVEYIDSLAKLFRTISVLSWPRSDVALDLLSVSLGTIPIQPTWMAQYFGMMMEKATDIARMSGDSKADVVPAYIELWCNHRNREIFDEDAISLSARFRTKFDEKKLIARIKDIVSSVPEKDRDRMVRSVGNFLHTFPYEFILTMMDMQVFETGKALADMLIKPPSNNLTTYANFAYAVKTIGPEKAAKLYLELGIENFYRYSKDVLYDVYSNLSDTANSGKPIFIAVMSKEDWNGAFYNEGRNLDSLLGKYRIVIAETDNEDGFYSYIEKARKRIGKPKGLLIGGHGTKDTIALGPRELGEKGMLDLSDETELARLKDLLESNSTIILDACSTGYSRTGIGSMISRSVPDADLYAPEVPTSIKRISVSKDGKIKVEYYSSSASFAAGDKSVE